MVLVDSAPATAASDESRNAVKGLSPAFSLCVRETFYEEAN